MDKKNLLLSLKVAHRELCDRQITKATERIGILVKILEKEFEEEKEVLDEQA
jgi:hypothetical protein